MSGLRQWYRCTCGAFTNDNTHSLLLCVRFRPSGQLAAHDWQPMPPKAETREQRTIRRLRALADGYRARLASLPTGDATANAVATMHETEHAGHASLPDAALWGQGRDAGVKAERARIVARLRTEAGKYGEGETELYVLREAADIIESEEP